MCRDRAVCSTLAAIPPQTGADFLLLAQFAHDDQFPAGDDRSIIPPHPTSSLTSSLAQHR